MYFLFGMAYFGFAYDIVSYWWHFFSPVKVGFQRRFSFRIEYITDPLKLKAACELSSMIARRSLHFLWGLEQFSGASCHKLLGFGVSIINDNILLTFAYHIPFDIACHVPLLLTNSFLPTAWDVQTRVLTAASHLLFAAEAWYCPIASPKTFWLPRFFWWTISECHKKCRSFLRQLV